MLADLREIRSIQRQMRSALIDADGARMEEIDMRRWEAQWRLMPLDQAGLSDADRTAAEALVNEITAEQESLIALAEDLRRRIGQNIGSVHQGRSAMAGYRVRGGDASVYIDRAL